MSRDVLKIPQLGSDSSLAATVSIQLSATLKLRAHYLGYPLVETSSCALAHMPFSCVQCRAFSYEQCTAYVYAQYKEASVCSIPKIKKKKTIIQKIDYKELLNKV